MTPGPPLQWCLTAGGPFFYLSAYLPADGLGKFGKACLALAESIVPGAGAALAPTSICVCVWGGGLVYQYVCVGGGGQVYLYRYTCVCVCVRECVRV